MKIFHNGFSSTIKCGWNFVQSLEDEANVTRTPMGVISGKISQKLLFCLLKKISAMLTCGEFVL